MLPVQLKDGWVRIFGATKTSSVRIYRYDGDLNIPEQNRKSWWVGSNLIIGYRTSVNNTEQTFKKGYDNYNNQLAILKSLEV